MSCDVGEATEGLENELWRRLENKQSYIQYNEQSSFSKLSVPSPASQLILQPFPRFTYVAAHSPTLPLLNLCHSSFSNPSFASPTSQNLHLRHLASRPWCVVSSMSGSLPETTQDRTQTKDTHSVTGYNLKFLTPPGIEPESPSWKAGFNRPLHRADMSWIQWYKLINKFHLSKHKMTLVDF